MRALAVLVLAALMLPHSAGAVITFTRLDDDIFVISHRVKFIGSRGKAQKLVYEKAASLCVAAGYSYFEILDQESEAAQEDDAANANIRVQLFQVDADRRIGCEKNASQEYVEQARVKLAKIGYQPPPATPEPSAATPEPPPPAGEEGAARSCTVEQISAMARAGLSDEQIRAACPD